MFEKTPRRSGRYPWKASEDSIGHRLDCLSNELVNQGHAEEGHDIVYHLVAVSLNLLDDNTVSSEIKSLAADLLRTYGEDWSVKFDDKTNARIKELLGD